MGLATRMAIGGAVVAVALSAAVPLAQPVFRGSEIFPAEEYAARRARVIAGIGDGVAIVLGATEPPGEMPFRQNSQCFYLSGVVEPRAVLIADGRTQADDGVPAAGQRAARHQHVRAGAGARTRGGERSSASTTSGPLADFTAAVTALAARAADDLHAVRGRGPGQPVAGRSEPDVEGEPRRSRGTAATRAKRRSSPA